MTAWQVYSHTPFFSPSVKNSVFATSLIRGRRWFLQVPWLPLMRELSAKLTEGETREVGGADYASFVAAASRSSGSDGTIRLHRLAATASRVLFL